MAKGRGRGKGGYYKVKSKLRSGLEDNIAQQIKEAGLPVTYEKRKITWTDKVKTYTPDFELPNGIIIEAKGIFDNDDRRKHLQVQAQYPDLDIRFVFSNPNAKLYKGAKSTYADWCTKNNFKYAHKLIPEEWLNE